jgi:excisionase family DNA binding protein
MPAVTVINLSAPELQRMLDQAVERAVLKAVEASGAEWGVAEVAAHLGVSVRTVTRMEDRGELPLRVGRRWLKADVLRWRKEGVEA